MKPENVFIFYLVLTGGLSGLMYAKSKVNKLESGVNGMVLGTLISFILYHQVYKKRYLY